jgi:hypothetical protein
MSLRYQQGKYIALGECFQQLIKDYTEVCQASQTRQMFPRGECCSRPLVRIEKPKISDCSVATSGVDCTCTQAGRLQFSVE